MQVEETHATGGLAATLAQEVARVAQLANEYYGIMGRACVQLERNLYTGSWSTRLLSIAYRTSGSLST